MVTGRPTAAPRIARTGRQTAGHACWQKKPHHVPALQRRPVAGILIPVRFERESGRSHVVRRKAVNARARTAIVLDIEENKATGDIVHRLGALQLASIVWTTHSHTAHRPRYRVSPGAGGTMPRRVAETVG